MKQLPRNRPNTHTNMKLNFTKHWNC